MKIELAYEIINNFIKEIDKTISNIKIDNKIQEINIILEEHSIEHAWIRLFVEFDNQVCNGGFFQYTINGCHSSKKLTNLIEVSDYDDVHQKFVKLSEQFFNSHQIKLRDTFLSIIKKFHVPLDLDEIVVQKCYTCDGSGENLKNVEDDDYIDFCHKCHGRGKIEINNIHYHALNPYAEILFKKLDKEYYAISDALIIQIAKYLKNKI